MKKITLYTDGACLGNPGPGGYAAILLFRNQRKEISGGYRLTTNNRMELMAAISGLESLVESCEVTLYSDSTYLVDSISKGWVERWKTKNWMRNSKNKVVNADLWKRYLNESGKHRINLVWVQGHAGDRENERADYLSVLAARRSDLPEDEGYLAGSKPPALF